jgi:hypothetical protein
LKAVCSLRSLTGRAAGLVVAVFLLCGAAVGGVSSATRGTRTWLGGDAPTALIARAIGVERPTLAAGAPSLDRRAPNARWSAGVLASAQYPSASSAQVRAVLLERPRSRVPRALRRTYDAHAPPGAIDRV